MIIYSFFLLEISYSKKQNSIRYELLRIIIALTRLNGTTSSDWDSVYNYKMEHLVNGWRQEVNIGFVITTYA